MHAHHPGPANPMQQLATQAERLAGEQQGSRLGLVFQGITAISLGAVTAMTVFDLIRNARRLDRERPGRHR